MRQLNAAPILMATLEAAGCGSDTPTAELATLEATEAATPEPTTAAEDPEPYDRFDMWIELGCPELWKAEGLAGTLSCGDVRNLVLLGCGKDWAAGSVDALLAEVYRAVDGSGNEAA